LHSDSVSAADETALQLTQVQCCVCDDDDAEPQAVGEDSEYRTSRDRFVMMQCRSCGGYLFPGHWNLFNRNAMVRLANKVGLDVVRISTQVSPVNWVYSIRNPDPAIRPKHCLPVGIASKWESCWRARVAEQAPANCKWGISAYTGKPVRDDA